MENCDVVLTMLSMMRSKEVLKAIRALNRESQENHHQHEYSFSASRYLATNCSK
jgi:hypothetical protein